VRVVQLQLQYSFGGCTWVILALIVNYFMTSKKSDTAQRVPNADAGFGPEDPKSADAL